MGSELRSYSHETVRLDTDAVFLCRTICPAGAKPKAGKIEALSKIPMFQISMFQISTSQISMPQPQQPHSLFGDLKWFSAVRMWLYSPPSAKASTMVIFRTRHEDQCCGKVVELNNPRGPGLPQLGSRHRKLPLVPTLLCWQCEGFRCNPRTRTGRRTRPLALSARQPRYHRV